MKTAFSCLGILCAVVVLALVSFPTSGQSLKEKGFVSAKDSRIDFEVYGTDDRIHCQGQARFGTHTAQPRVEISQLREQMRDMGLHGCLAHEQHRADLGVGSPPPDLGQHIVFAR